MRSRKFTTPVHMLTLIGIMLLSGWQNAIAIGEGGVSKTGGDVGVVTVELKNPLQVSTPQQLAGNITNALLGIAGALTLAVVVYGGFMYLTSRGESDKMRTGRDLVLWGAIGLAVTVGAYLIVQLMFSFIDSLR